jgi:hypothetical protein
MVPLRLRDATGVWDCFNCRACLRRTKCQPPRDCTVNMSFELDMTYSLEGDATLQLRASDGIPSGRQVSNCGAILSLRRCTSALDPNVAPEVSTKLNLEARIVSDFGIGYATTVTARKLAPRYCPDSMA